MPTSRPAAAALATQLADASQVKLLSHTLPVILFHQHALLRMALCCYSRDYRGGPFTSMNQLSACRRPSTALRMTSQAQYKNGLQSNHQSVPGDVLADVLANYGPEDSFTPCFRPSSNVMHVTLPINSD